MHKLFFTATVYFRGIGLIFAETSGTRTYYHQNAHGDVVMMTNSTGSVVKTYEYDAFGREWDALDTDNNPFRYCGEYFDRQTKTVYLRARYYDSAYGRFTQQDGWQYADANDPLSLNLYTYCWNNPVNMVDPDGHSAASVAAKFAPAILAQMAALASLGAKALVAKITAMVVAIAPYLFWILVAVVAILVTIVIVEQVKAAEAAKEAAKAVEATAEADDKRANEDEKDKRSLPIEGEPNSSSDLYDKDGNLKQRRYYGPDGKAERDIDYSHQDSHGNHEFPHEHRWDWSKKIPRQ